MPDEAKYFIGECNVIKADSVGEPGKRTFKMEAVSDFGSITLWMEKESLFQVGISLGEFIATRKEPETKEPFDSSTIEVKEIQEIEFQCIDLSIIHDPSGDLFTINAQGSDNDDVLFNASFTFSRIQAEELSSTILKVIAAGRQPCFLCAAPLDPNNPHLCLKLNGNAVKTKSDN